MAILAARWGIFWPGIRGEFSEAENLPGEEAIGIDGRLACSHRTEGTGCGIQPQDGAGRGEVGIGQEGLRIVGRTGEPGHAALPR